MKHLLKYSRIAVSVFCLSVITALASGWGAAFLISLHVIEKVQFIPLILSVSVTTVVLWIVITFLFGRIYCSSVCPLGTFQDIFIRLPRITKKMREKRRFSYTIPLSTLRYSALVIVFASLLAGITAFAMILDPYAIYTRLVKLMAFKLAGASAIAFAITMSTVILIAVVAARKGRLWCNTLCPVGTTLGMVSRYSVFHFDINTDICTNCRRCVDHCKAQCIDLNDHVVDGSRCINCFNCVDVCPDDAITYTTRRHRLSIPMLQRLSDRSDTAPADAMTGEK